MAGDGRGLHARMRLSEAALNAFGLLLCLLFVTGGVVPSAGAPRVLTEVNQLGPWVAGFIVFVAWRRFRDRDGTLAGRSVAAWLQAGVTHVCATPIPFYVFTAVWTLLLGAVAIRRYFAYEDNGDLAIFDQAFWNTIHGAFVRSSLIPQATGEVSIFADHFDPLQLILLPLYLGFPSPFVLLAAQAVALALGALPLYWIARGRFPDSPVLYTTFPVLYLLCLPLRGANRYDYHPSALTPVLFLLALYFMDRSRWAWMVVFLTMAGLLKENLPVAGVMIGLYLLFVERRRLLGLALVAAFGFWFYAGFAWIVPAFNTQGYLHFEDYISLGETASEILLAPFQYPLDAVEALFTAAERKVSYLVYVFAPVAFLPFLSPARLLLGLPFLAQNLLSAAPHQTSLQTHHAAELIPFVFYAAVGGASNLLRSLDHTHDPSRKWDAVGVRRVLAGCLLAGSLLFHGLPETFYLRLYARTPHHERLDAAIRMIPAEASVSTWTKILSHVSQRRALYRFPSLGFEHSPAADFVLIDHTLLPRTDVAEVTDVLAELPAKGYEKVLDEDGIVLYRKRA